MDEIESKKPKPKLCMLAILSPLLVIFIWQTAMFAMVIFRWQKAMFAIISPDFLGKAYIPVWVVSLIFIVLLLGSIIVGITALIKIHKSQGQLRGNFIALFGIVVALFLVYLCFCALMGS